MICMNTITSKLLLWWSLCWFGLGVIFLQESIVVFAAKSKRTQTKVSQGIAQPPSHIHNACDLPLGNIFGRIARLRVLVVDQAQLAALFSWCDPIQANVKFGTVRGIGVFGMWIGQAKGVRFRRDFGAFEAIFRNLMGLSAASPPAISRPVADTAEFVKPKSG